MTIKVGDCVWEKDRGGDTLRGGIVLDVIELMKKVVVVQSFGKDRKGKATINTATLSFDEIDMDMIEDPGIHERGKLVRALLLRMGQRNHALRTQEDERDIAAIDALWSD